MLRKIILSRKGFDSINGGIPSPIISNGTILSLPIPYEDDCIDFYKLSYNGKSYLEIIKNLGYSSTIEKCHLDPDLYRDIKLRSDDWKACFGQDGIAQLHLERKSVDVGDIFLFFGWFKKTNDVFGEIKYIKRSDDLHAFFGYLQVGRILKSEEEITTVNWHPHSKYGTENHNVIYVASDNLLETVYPGYGVFRYSDELVLTKKGYSRSKWELPDCLRDKEISYHKKESQKADYFQSAMIGQEFVLDSDEEIEKWIITLVEKNRISM